MSVEIYLHSTIRLHGVVLNEARGEFSWSLTNFPFSVAISLALRDVFLTERSHNPFDIILALELTPFGLRVAQHWLLTLHLILPCRAGKKTMVTPNVGSHLGRGVCFSCWSVQRRSPGVFNKPRHSLCSCAFALSSICCSEPMSIPRYETLSIRLFAELYWGSRPHCKSHARLRYHPSCCFSTSAR
jgi:hypothetical protein